MDIAIEKYGDREGGGFFDRASDAPPMGGLDVRRKPSRIAKAGSESVAAMALTRLPCVYGRTEILRLGGEDAGSVCGNCARMECLQQRMDWRRRCLRVIRFRYDYGRGGDSAAKELEARRIRCFVREAVLQSEVRN